MQNQTCFLLSYIKYADSDAVLHCFSKESGFQTFFVKGIYSPKNKKKAYLFPLNHINITLTPKKGSGTMQSVSKIEKGDLNFDLEDVKTNTILFFVADFLHQILREETLYNTIFNEIEVFAKELCAKNYNAYIALIFAMLKSQGISPLISSNEFLEPETGTFSNIQNHHLFDADMSIIWKNYLTHPNGYELKLNRQERTKTLTSLFVYYQLHFSGFYKPKSLAIVEDLFS